MSSCQRSWRSAAISIAPWEDELKSMSDGNSLKG